MRTTPARPGQNGPPGRGRPRPDAARNARRRPRRSAPGIHAPHAPGDRCTRHDSRLSHAPRGPDRAGPGHCPPRARLRRCRPDAGRNRLVWRPVLWRRPAHQRDRRPHRPRRASLARHRHDCPGDRRSGRYGRAHRWRSRLCRIALHCRQPVRRRTAGSATFTLAAAVLLVVAGIAAYLPARRASKLEPVAALRSE